MMPNMSGPDPGYDDYPDETCEVCGGSTVQESCWQCGGSGAGHDCGEDCCCCLMPEDNITCEECDGIGSYPVCVNLPHTDKQIDAFFTELRRDRAGMDGV